MFKTIKTLLTFLLAFYIRHVYKFLALKSVRVCLNVNVKRVGENNTDVRDGLSVALLKICYKNVFLQDASVTLFIFFCRSTNQSIVRGSYLKSNKIKR